MHIVQAANPGGVSIDEQGVGNLLTDTLSSKWLDSNITQADGSILSTVILYLGKEVQVAKYRLVAAADNERRQPVSWEVGIAGTEGGFFPLSTVSEGSTGVTYYMVAPPPPPTPPPPQGARHPLPPLPPNAPPAPPKPPASPMSRLTSSLLTSCTVAATATE